MKPKTIYQIHALIGYCHLHTKKKSTYSITLKMGSKNLASTQFKLPHNDQINFNTELILKIDKALFQGPGKLSMIVTMLSQQKEKKIIGSVFVNYKQKGHQCITVSQCSCKDKGFDVNVEFEVVNIQNLNNNQINNKIQSPNHSQMKDLKKALTVSRQKQLVKSSRVKQSTAIKPPAEKTQSKLNKPKLQKQHKNELSSNLSSLTTKIVPNSSRLNQQTKQYVNELKDKIQELEVKIKDYSIKERSHKKQVTQFQSQISILKAQNECLIDLLKFQQEKSSAAINYIQYLTDKISQKQLLDSNLNEYLKMIQRIKQNEKTDACEAITQHKKLAKNLQDYSFEFKPIQQKQQMNQQSAQKLTRELQYYRTTIQQMRHRISQMQAQQTQKTQNLNYLEVEVSKMNKQNDHLKYQLDRTQKAQKQYCAQIKILKINNQNLQASIRSFQNQLKEVQRKLNQSQKSLKQSEKQLKQQDQNNKKLKNQKLELQKTISRFTHQNKTLKQKINDLQQQSNKLKNIEMKYQQHLKQNNRKINDQQRLSLPHNPKTPFQSQISPHKQRFQEGDTGLIENIIEQINGCIDSKQDLLLSSRRVQDNNDHFLSRNKSESLLKDLQVDPQSQDPNTNQTSKDIYKATYHNTNSDSSQKKIKTVNIPQHQKQVQKYNYEYDLDSLNYFNNFQEDHDGISEVTASQDNCEV